MSFFSVFDAIGDIFGAFFMSILNLFYPISFQ
jgi:hypothetical protein